MEGRGAPLGGRRAARSPAERRWPCDRRRRWTCVLHAGEHANGNHDDGDGKRQPLHRSAGQGWSVGAAGGGAPADVHKEVQTQKSGADECWSQPKSDKKKVLGEAAGGNPPAGQKLVSATPPWRSAPAGQASSPQAGATVATAVPHPAQAPKHSGGSSVGHAAGGGSADPCLLFVKNLPGKFMRARMKEMLAPPASFLRDDLVRVKGPAASQFAFFRAARQGGV